MDLRLAIGAAAAWLALLVVPQHSALVVATVGVTAGVVGLGASFAVRRGGSAVALSGFAITLVLLPVAGRLARGDSPLVELAAHHLQVSATLTIASDPRPLAAKGPAGIPRIVVDAHAIAVTVDGRWQRVSGTVFVIAPTSAGWTGLLPGQRVRVDGGLAPALLDPSAVSLVVHGDPERIGRSPWWQRAAGRVRASLRSAASGLPDGPRGLLPGLVDGDTSDLDPVLAEHFRIAGMTHLVAVSGMNCSILLGVVLLAMRRAGARPWITAIVGSAVVVAFVVVARPSPSVLRAAVMALLTLGAFASGRPRQGIPVLAAAVLGLLIWDPGLADDPAFVMSVGATAALLMIAPGWAAALRRHHVPPGVAEAFAVAAAAHIVTAPVVVAISGRLSLVAIPANVLAEPVVAAATILGFLAALVAPICLPVGRVLAELAGWPCRWLVAVADHFGSMRGAALPWPAGVRGGFALAAAIAAVAWLIRRRGLRRVMVAAAMVAAIVQWPARWVLTNWPPRGWVFAACDVGQGDGLVVPVGPGSAVVIDTGPEPIAIDRCLHDLGIRQIPMLILTHMHLDHVAGISGALRGRRVGQVVTGPLLEPRTGLDLVEAYLRRRGAALRSLPDGRHFVVGAARFEVLGPRSAFTATHSDPNNSSITLRVTVDGVRLLLAGDMEIESQSALLSDRIDVHADILKVPHHGSAYFDRDFLAAVGAHTGVISVGLHNDYGHPSPLLLRALVGLGIQARRTDLDGDVVFIRTAGGPRAIVRGKRGSTLGMSGPVRPREATPAEVVSERGARIGACQPARSASTTCPSCGCCPVSCSSSVTRSSSSAGPSARSPPPRAQPIRR